MQLDDHDYECSGVTIDEWDLGHAGLDAIVTITAAIAGTFSSETAMDGTMSGTQTCVGTDCSIAEEEMGIVMPCVTEVELDGSFQR